MLTRAAALTVAALNWAVSVIECGGDCTTIRVNALGVPLVHAHGRIREYASDWGAAGYIIEREKIQLRGIEAPGHPWHGLWLAQFSRFRPTNRTVDWRAHNTFTCATLDTGYYEGPTALIAAMRCYVAMKLGNEIDVPDLFIAAAVTS